MEIIRDSAKAMKKAGVSFEDGFKYFDTDNSGFIRPQEFFDGFQRMGMADTDL